MLFVCLDLNIHLSVHVFSLKISFSSSCQESLLTTNSFSFTLLCESVFLLSIFERCFAYCLYYFCWEVNYWCHLGFCHVTVVYHLLLTRYSLHFYLSTILPHYVWMWTFCAFSLLGVSWASWMYRLMFPMFIIKLEKFQPLIVSIYVFFCFFHSLFFSFC